MFCYFSHMSQRYCVHCVHCVPNEKEQNIPSFQTLFSSSIVTTQSYNKAMRTGPPANIGCQTLVTNEIKTPFVKQPTHSVNSFAEWKQNKNPVGWHLSKYSLSVKAGKSKFQVSGQEWESLPGGHKVRGEEQNLWEIFLKQFRFMFEEQIVEWILAFKT